MATQMTKRQRDEREYQSFRFSTQGTKKVYAVAFTHAERKAVEKMLDIMLPARTSFPAVVGFMECAVSAKKITMTKPEMKVLDRVIRIYVERKKKNTPVALVTAAWTLHNAVK